MYSLRYRIVVVLMIVSLASCRGWLRAEGSEIENQLLVETPLATSKAQVLAVSRTKGRAVGDGGELTPNISNYPVPSGEGKSYLRAHIGSYGVVLTVDVIAFYIFDEEERLVAIHVRKDVDAP